MRKANKKSHYIRSKRRKKNNISVNKKEKGSFVQIT